MARSPRAAWIAAAAALVVVGILFVTTGSPGRSPMVDNELLELRVQPVRGGWALFSGIQFDLEGRAKSALPCRVIARKDGETDEALAARVATDAAGRTFVPLVLDAEVVLPDATTRRGPVVRVEGEFGAMATRLRVELIDVMLPHPAISPMVAARLHEHGAAEDFLWAFARGGKATLGGTHGFVPEEPGEYRIRFVLRSFTKDDARFVTFAEPLVAATTFSVGGAVGDWSQPTDGLCARVASGTRRIAAGAPLAIAMQLANRSDRARAYNVAGITQPPIPQPFHFDLVVDGEPWTQRRDLAVIFSGDSGFLPQPEDTVRTVIVLADYWRRDGVRLADLPGRHKVALRFHFVPTLWSGDPRDLWQGEIDTPPIEIEITR